MIAELALPRLGETMETGRVVAWLKQPGQRFVRGETLVEIESDKTVVEMPALADGTLVEILVPEGQDADVGAPLCRYEDGGMPAPATDTAPPPEPAPVPSPPVAVSPMAASPIPAPSAHVPATSRHRATPLARALARRHGVSLDTVVGTGRRARIEAEDVRAALAGDAGGERIAVPGGAIAYRGWGVADPARASIVMLHGLAGDARTWAGLAALLARQGEHVVAADLPGHGATTIAAATVEAMAEAMTMFLRAVAARPVHLVGHSLGGAVAARVARAAPERVARLTLLAPVGLDRAIDTDFVRGIAGIRSGGALAHLLRRLTVRPPGLSPAQLDAMAADLARGRLAALAEAMVDAGGQAIDIVADLHTATVPVRIIWGLQDRIIPWTQVGAAGSRAAIHLLAECGHVPHWDQPAEVAALLT
jgi:pyruvate dehydrogenase E2 component (dihydrolipoamide acetyltransferase)